MLHWLRTADKVRLATVLAVCLVALDAAIVSYSHMHDFAMAHGERWRSYLTPLLADGLVVAASMTLLTQYRTNHKGGLLPWLSLLGGAVASTVINMADARADWPSRLFAGSAAVAFALTFHMLILQRRASQPATAETPVSRGTVQTAQSRQSSLPAVPDPVSSTPPATPSAPRVPRGRPERTRESRESTTSALPSRTTILQTGFVQSPQGPMADPSLEAARIRREQAFRLFDDEHATGVTKPSFEIEKAIGVSRATVYRYRREWLSTRGISQEGAA